jgi:hypothetical protein
MRVAIHHAGWCLTEAERRRVMRRPSAPPKAADLLFEMGLCLAVPLMLAFGVGMALTAAGFPPP